MIRVGRDGGDLWPGRKFAQGELEVTVSLENRNPENHYPLVMPNHKTLLLWAEGLRHILSENPREKETLAEIREMADLFARINHFPVERGNPRPPPPPSSFNFLEKNIL